MTITAKKHSARIKLSQVTYHYDHRPALDRVDVELVGPGVIGLLGRNGAGKSTLLGILSGSLAPASGTLRLLGEDVTHTPDALRQRVGLLPEHPALHDEMRVEAFLSWCLAIRSTPKHRREEFVADALALAQLEEVAQRHIRELSHGFKKRVGIACAMVHKPSIILLDEPISGLDPAQIIGMREIVARIGEDALVVISSHILGEISQTCDHLIMLEEGRLVLDRAWDREPLPEGMIELRVELGHRRAEARAILDSVALVERCGDLVETSSSSTRASCLIHEEARAELVRALVECGADVLTVEVASSDLDALEALFITRRARHEEE